MALQNTVLLGGRTPREIVARVVLVNVAIVIAMLALTALLGVAEGGASYSIVPDPAAGIGLPF